MVQSDLCYFHADSGPMSAEVIWNYQHLDKIGVSKLGVASHDFQRKVMPVGRKYHESE
jgi:hypothetical protein